MKQRLQKILSHAGVASRRKSEELIAAGRVSVNGVVATVGMSADIETDEITIDGRKLQLEKKRYILLNKPAGYITTLEDKHAPKKVVDLIKIKERVYPVGRLDADTEGLLLLTNDGDFAQKIAHPRNETTKEYEAHLEKPLSEAAAQKLTQGIVIEGRKVAVAITNMSGDRRTISLQIHEGRHKIVKRLFKNGGNYVLHLKRTRVGNVRLGNLKTGQWRDLTEQEIRSLTS